MITVLLYGISIARHTLRNYKTPIQSSQGYFNDHASSFESIFSKVNLPTLHMTRLRCIATESQTYKCINIMSPEYLKDLVEVKQSKYSFRYEITVKRPTVRPDI